jgi:glycosyltransferase involved in cell wall biosynthesis
MTPQTLSLLIVARNEEQQIEDCIRSGACADEVVVVLDRSDDRTAEMAVRLGAKIVEGTWEDEGVRRTAAIDACTGDWIIELDADERISLSLGGEIKEKIASGKADYYLIPFHNFVGGNWIEHGWGAYNGVAAKACLFRRGMKRWVPGPVHPKIHLDGHRGELVGHIDHYVYENIAGMYDRLNRYSSAAALGAIAHGEIPRPRSTFRRFFSRFIKSYWQRRGYKEGWCGVALAMFSAMYPVLTHVKILEQQDKSAGEN